MRSTAAGVHRGRPVSPAPRPCSQRAHTHTPISPALAGMCAPWAPRSTCLWTTRRWVGGWEGGCWCACPPACPQLILPVAITPSRRLSAPPTPADCAAGVPAARHLGHQVALGPRAGLPRAGGGRSVKSSGWGLLLMYDCGGGAAAYCRGPCAYLHSCMESFVLHGSLWSAAKRRVDDWYRGRGDTGSTGAGGLARASGPARTPAPSPPPATPLPALAAAVRRMVLIAVVAGVSRAEGRRRASRGRRRSGAAVRVQGRQQVGWQVGCRHVLLHPRIHGLHAHRALACAPGEQGPGAKHGRW